MARNKTINRKFYYTGVTLKGGVIMDTIFNYVESVFINLPRTSEMEQLKADMLHNMEDKYQDLKGQGVSENEAIGTVLSEFGNIDEIVEEYRLSKNEETIDPDTIQLDNSEVEAFMLHRNQYAFGISLGTFMCIISVPLLFLTMQIFNSLFPSLQDDIGNILGVVILLITVAIAVALFIIFGMRETNFPYKNKLLEVDPYFYSQIKQEYQLFKPRFTYAIAAGVVLCILGPVFLLLSFILLGEDNFLGVALLMSFIATGVFLFVFFGIQKDTYEKVLSIGEHTRIHMKTNKITETVSSIVFPLATLYFLYQGFIHNNWDSAWVVFPIVGIGFGIFAAITEAIGNIREKK